MYLVQVGEGSLCTEQRGCRSLGCCSAVALGGMELSQSGISSETALQEVMCVPSPFQVLPGICSQICFLTLVTLAVNPFPVTAQYPIVTQGRSVGFGKHWHLGGR